MRDVVNSFLSIVTIVVVFSLVIVPYVGVTLAKMIVQPPAGISLERWIESFKDWAIVVSISSGALALVWFITTQWGFKVDRWEDAGKRSWWFFLFLLVLVVVIVAIVFTESTRVGGWFIYVFYTFTGILCYYLATLLGSPAAFKYTPPLSSRFQLKRRPQKEG